MNPLVTIIIPAYNTQDFIRESVESALAQTYSSIEVIVVDDGSTDKTKDILLEFGDKIRYLYQENQGESVARNRGLKESRGEYIIFLDADDILVPNMADWGMDKILSDGFTAAYGLRTEFSTSKLASPRAYGGPKQSGNIFPLIVKCKTLVPGQFVMHRRCLEDAGGFDEDCHLGEDWALLLKVSYKYKFGFVPKTFLLKRSHSQMQTLTAAERDILADARMLLKRIFPENADAIERKYLDRFTLAGWFRSYGLNQSVKGNALSAKNYILKSLKRWPLQPMLWLWVCYYHLPKQIRFALKNAKQLFLGKTS